MMDKPKPFTILQHIPGPWEVDEEGEVCSAGAATIAQVYQADDFPCIDDDERDLVQKECEANGRLIAAAPDLYAAVLHALSMCETEWTTYDADIMRAAIGKATGGPR